MTKQVIPSHFSRYFWDVHLEDVDVQEHQIFIIERLLNEGDQATLAWVLDTYSPHQIKLAVMTSRNLNRLTARYWQVYFELKEDDMRCFGASSTITDDLF